MSNPKKLILVFINFYDIANFELADLAEIVQFCLQGKTHDNKRQPAISTSLEQPCTNIDLSRLWGILAVLKAN